MTASVILTCLTCGQGNRIPRDKLAADPKCAKCSAPLLTGAVAELNGTVHNKAARLDQLPIIVDYWAEWCGPCKMMAPEFAKAAKTLQTSARFAKLNTEEFPEISGRLQIKGIPLLILYKSGREVARLSGARPASDIEAFARQNLQGG